MDATIEARLVDLAHTYQAAERAVKIAVVDAINAKVATKSQVSRHTGVARSTIDTWLKNPEVIAQARVAQAIDAAHQLDVEQWPSHSDIDAGRVPDAAVTMMRRARVREVCILLRAGSRENPGEPIGARQYVGAYGWDDQRRVTDFLAARLNGAEAGFKSSEILVVAWVDDLPVTALDSIPF